MKVAELGHSLFTECHIAEQEQRPRPAWAAAHSDQGINILQKHMGKPCKNTQGIQGQRGPKSACASNLIYAFTV